MVQGTCVSGFSSRGGTLSFVELVTLGSLEQEARKLLQNTEQGLRNTALQNCSNCDVIHASRLGPLDFSCEGDRRNLVCMRATWNSTRRMKNEYVYV
jgi:hypothetical protein